MFVSDVLSLESRLLLYLQEGWPWLPWQISWESAYPGALGAV